MFETDEMTTRPIRTAADARVVGVRLTALLDRGDAAGAIALADAARGDEALVTQLRAYAYTEGGRQLGDRALTERGRDLWHSLVGQAPDGGYNLANSE
jgi:hypothetical protein